MPNAQDRGAAEDPGVSPRTSCVRKLAHSSRPLPPEAAAARLVAALIARGVDTFFGIPGGPVCPVFEAIRLAPGARLIESRHESHAGFAAALYQRASGRTPAIVVTAGPGATNAVTGIASASLERTPLLLIVGDVAWATTGGRMAQDSGPEGLALETLFSSITRKQVRASSARSAVTQALAALDAAQNPLDPGPALYVLPLDHAMQQVSEIEIAAPVHAALHAAPPDTVSRARRWLERASRPLIVLGAGCRGHEAVLAQLMDRLAVPFVTTPRAKGLVSERHPCSLRNGGMAASLWARRYTSEPIDVCLALGTDLDDTSMGPTRYLGEGGKLMHVDLDARVFGRNLPTALGVCADLGAFAGALLEEARGSLATDAAQVALREVKSTPAFDVAQPERDEHTPIRSHRLMADLEAAAGSQARFVTDIGEHMLFALHYLSAEPGSFFVQLNLGSMASGIAGAIGLALADRSRPVICIAGDGGMQMAGMEALVALRERLPILFVVLNDSRYNMVHHGMRQIFGEASLYDTPPIDFCTWASSFSMPAAIVRRPGELDRALIERLFGSGGPALVDVRIDPSMRIRDGGRVEALQQMSMLGQAPGRLP